MAATPAVVAIFEIRAQNRVEGQIWRASKRPATGSNVSPPPAAAATDRGKLVRCDLPKGGIGRVCSAGVASEPAAVRFFPAAVQLGPGSNPGGITHPARGYELTAVKRKGGSPGRSISTTDYASSTRGGAEPTQTAPSTQEKPHQRISDHLPTATCNAVQKNHPALLSR